MNAMISTLAPMSALVQRWFAGSARNGVPTVDQAAASASAEAAAVRELADSYRASDPSFASDLYAAADRHEQEAELAAGR